MLCFATYSAFLMTGWRHENSGNTGTQNRFSEGLPQFSDAPVTETKRRSSYGIQPYIYIYMHAYVNILLTNVDNVGHRLGHQSGLDES